MASSSWRATAVFWSAAFRVSRPRGAGFSNVLTLASLHELVRRLSFCAAGITATRWATVVSWSGSILALRAALISGWS